MSPPVQPLRLLLVEDDPADRDLVHLTLRQEDVAITDAGSLQVATALLAESAFDCLILDWRLPDGSATRLLADIRASQPELPVIVLTGSKDERLAQHVLETGAQDYLVKGELGHNDLVRAVKYAVQRQRAAQLTDQLDHAQRLASIGLLAAGVAHELNNPAHVLLSNLTVLQERVTDDQYDPLFFAQVLKDCVRSLKRISSLTDGLTRFSRKNGHVAKVDFRHLIEEAVTLAQPSLRHHASLQLELAHCPMVIADPNAMTGVIINLLVNAQQAMQLTPNVAHKIHVSLKPGEDTLSIGVEDSGPGIPSADKERLFEPFITRTPNGTGLGLAICREIVSAHQGQITVDASPLGGAAFRITIPYRTGLELPQESPPLNAPASLKILVVDDEEPVRNAILRLLKDYDVEAAPSARAALDMLRTGYEPDVVLCDLVLPEMTGAQLIEQLSSELPRLIDRAIIMTGGAPTPGTRAYLQTTNVPVLKKPFTIVQLKSAIARITSRRASTAVTEPSPL